MANGEPLNTYEAVLDHVSKGLTPLGQRLALAVTDKGDLYSATRVFRTTKITVPGIGAAVAYTAADAFGTKFYFSVPTEGTISNVIFLDYDDEGIIKDLVLFSEDFTETADNTAFAVTDLDLANCVGVARVNSYTNFSVNQVGQGQPALAYVAPHGRLYCQIVTQGADDIAAGASPDVYLVIV